MRKVQCSSKGSGEVPRVRNEKREREGKRGELTNDGSFNVELSAEVVERVAN